MRVFQEFICKILGIPKVSKTPPTSETYLSGSNYGNQSYVWRETIGYNGGISRLRLTVPAGYRYQTRREL